MAYVRVASDPDEHLVVQTFEYKAEERIQAIYVPSIHVRRKEIKHIVYKVGWD